MGIALLTLSALFEQLPAWSTRRSACTPLGGTARPATGLATTTVGPSANRRFGPDALTGGNRDPRHLPGSKPLRVMQITDAASRPGTVGRLLMSGRMADVCAELDRLAALEDRQLMH